MFRSVFAAALLSAAFLAAPAHAHDGPLSPDRKAEIEALVRDYILQHPEIILESVAIMQAREDAAKNAAAKQALVDHREALERDPADPVLGNPDGDVTIVEFFDYQCGYCKTMMKPLMELVEEDGNIRLVLKEFPILSPTSEAAALASLAADRQGRYKDFHTALLGLRGRLTTEAIFQVALETGLDVEKLQADMKDPALQAHVRKSFELAQALSIQGTPAFTIGDHVVPGAVSKEQLAELVAEAREKG
ncbi:DsbA family protein [Thalassobaculum salexigens]|uniref:DsbA family protein n=1 Tax=Thalassobaculum salexigens TaxID=455360 RepID=UPI00248E6CFE|nr:DsbA family protein [Thalassobaculum salexigens]